MTGTAIFPEIAFVCIVFQMTCAAIGRFRLEIGGCVSAEMTFGARLPCVFACQLEGGAAVVKVLADGFNSIMAAPAICSVILGVFLHENGIHLLVAAGAERDIKFGDIVAMTVRAGELLTITSPLV